jgi:hypothetical protein
MNARSSGSSIAFNILLTTAVFGEAPSMLLSEVGGILQKAKAHQAYQQNKAKKYHSQVAGL